jgi:hypothetical protein
LAHIWKKRPFKSVVVCQGDNPKFPFEHLRKNQPCTAALWIAGADDADVEVMKTLAGQNAVYVLAAIRGAGAAQDDALLIDQVG